MKEPERNSFLQKKTQNFRLIFFLYYRELLFFAGIFGIIFPVQKLTGIFLLMDQLLQAHISARGTGRCFRAAPRKNFRERHITGRRGSQAPARPAGGRKPGGQDSPAESALPSASAGHRPPGKDRQQPEGSLFLPEIPALGKKRSGRDPKEDRGRFAALMKETS